MMAKKRKRLQTQMYDGYFTVEAAFIIPMVLFVYLFIIYMAFYQYDRCVIMQDTYRLALQGSSMISGSKQSIYDQIRKRQKQWGFQRYVALKTEKSDINVSNKKVVVKQKGKLQVPFTNTQGVLPNQWKIVIEKESMRMIPVSVIRECRRIQKMIESGGLQTEDHEKE